MLFQHIQSSGLEISMTEFMVNLSGPDPIGSGAGSMLVLLEPVLQKESTSSASGMGLQPALF